MTFPLTSWETFRVVIPERFNATGGDLVKGVVHGRPGDTVGDVKARARFKDMAGLFPDAEIELEWIDR